MGTHNICLYKEVDKKYTGYNLKTMELLDCVLIGVCAVIRSNMVCQLKISYSHSLVEVYAIHHTYSSNNALYACWVNISVDDKLGVFFLFSLKIMYNISYKLHPKEMIFMKFHFLGQ